MWMKMGKEIWIQIEISVLGRKRSETRAPNPVSKSRNSSSEQRLSFLYPPPVPMLMTWSGTIIIRKLGLEIPCHESCQERLAGLPSVCV